MLKKNLLYIGAFILLVIFNIAITVKIQAQNKRYISTNRLLSDIDHAQNTHSQFSLPSAPLVLGTYETSIGVGDARAANLRAFFRDRNSPLYDYADYLVKVADENNMDYRLIPAISIQESGGCVHIPEGSHNCWGWGIYGGMVTKFSSYEEAIETVAKGLKENYIDHGLVTPEQIMTRYNPGSPNGSWAIGVSKIWGWLE